MFESVVGSKTPCYGFQVIGGSGGKSTVSPSELSSKEAKVEAISILRSSEVP